MGQAASYAESAINRGLLRLKTLKVEDDDAILLSCGYQRISSSEDSLQNTLAGTVVSPIVLGKAGARGKKPLSTAAPLLPPPPSFGPLASLTAPSYSIDELREALQTLPEALWVNLHHVSLLYVLDADLDGKISRADIALFIDWSIATVARSVPAEQLSEVIHAHATLQCWYRCIQAGQREASAPGCSRQLPGSSLLGPRTGDVDHVCSTSAPRGELRKPLTSQAKNASVLHFAEWFLRFVMEQEKTRVQERCLHLRRRRLQLMAHKQRSQCITEASDSLENLVGGMDSTSSAFSRVTFGANRPVLQPPNPEVQQSCAAVDDPSASLSPAKRSLEKQRGNHNDMAHYRGILRRLPTVPPPPPMSSDALSASDAYRESELQPAPSEFCLLSSPLCHYASPAATDTGRKGVIGSEPHMPPSEETRRGMSTAARCAMRAESGLDEGERKSSDSLPSAGVGGREVVAPKAAGLASSLRVCPTLTPVDSASDATADTEDDTDEALATALQDTNASYTHLKSHGDFTVGAIGEVYDDMAVRDSYGISFWAFCHMLHEESARQVEEALGLSTERATEELTCASALEARRWMTMKGATCSVRTGGVPSDRPASFPHGPAEVPPYVVPRTTLLSFVFCFMRAHWDMLESLGLNPGLMEILQTSERPDTQAEIRPQS